MIREAIAFGAMSAVAACGPSVNPSPDVSPSSSPAACANTAYVNLLHETNKGGSDGFPARVYGGAGDPNQCVYGTTETGYRTAVVPAGILVVAKCFNKETKQVTIESTIGPVKVAAADHGKISEYLPKC